MNGDDQVLARIEGWRRQLIDLSYGNRLIRYAATKATSLTITAPDVTTILADSERTRPWRFYLPPELEEGAETGVSETAEFLDEIVVQQSAARTRRDDEIVVTEPNPKRIHRILDNLAKRSNAEFEDKALRILYLAVGFLDWVDPARDEKLSSPLVLVPVRLSRRTATDAYELNFVDDEEIVINPSLTEKLRRDAQLALPEDWAWEDKPIDVELAEIRAAVSPYGWTVREDAALGLFSFQKYVMYRDLLDHEAVVAQHPIIRSLAAKQRLEDEHAHPLPAMAQLDDVQPPEQALSVRDADATQRFCVEAAKRGQSFVMHGPPGTGKSQTIANIIAEAIGQGKKVLFVSEKAAALDVVYNRLAEHQLEEYVLMLHGEHAARREVVHALAASLTSEIQARPGLGQDQFDRLQTLRDLLNNSVEELHVKQPMLGDRSLREVYGELAARHDAPTVPGAPGASSRSGPEARLEYQQLQEQFERLAERWRVAGPDFPWRAFAGTTLRDDQRAALLKLLGELQDATGRLAEVLGNGPRALGFDLDLTAHSARWLRELAASLREAPVLERDWLHHGRAQDIERTIEVARAAYAARAEARQTFSAQLGEQPLDEFPTAVDDALDTAVDELRQALGQTPGWDDNLIGRLPELSQLRAELPDRLGEIGVLANEVAQALGHLAKPRRLGDLERLLELAQLAFLAHDRPDAEWLLGAGLQRARSALDRSRSVLAAYQSGRLALLERYDAELFELDGRAVRNRFLREYDEPFLDTERQYREDRQALAAVRYDGQPPLEPRRELEAFVALARVQEEAQLKRETLLARFNPAVLELDGGALLERFSGPHTKTFAKLGKAYRQDAKAVRAVRPDHKLGESLLDDLGLLVLVQDRQRNADARRATLQADWDEPAFALEHAALLQRVTGLYIDQFRTRHDRYDADLEAVFACAHEETPETAVRADVEALAEVQSQGREIDDASVRDQVAFGGYYAARDTDPDAVARALHVAEQVLRLADRDADLTYLSERVALGSRIDPELARTADQLAAAIGEARERLGTVSEVAGRSEGWSGDLATDALAIRLTEALGHVAPVEELAHLLTEAGRRPASLFELAVRARAVTHRREAEATVAASELQWHGLIGSRFSGADTNWEDCQTVADWLREIERITTQRDAAWIGDDELLPHPARERLLVAERGWDELDQVETALGLYEPDVAKLLAQFAAPRSDVLGAVAADGLLSDACEQWATLASHVDDLRDYIELGKARARVARDGWGDFVAALLDDAVAPEVMVDAFVRAYWARRLETLETQAPELFEDDGTTYARWIDEFRWRDRQLVETGADRLIAARNHLRPALVNGAGSEVAIIKAEAGKRRRFRPVRKILAAMPTLLSELKPCLMMSPLTVSHFLTPEHHFDLVVFDEASQVPPQDAINCIYRGDQLIVAGDSNQLPPTAFFQVSELAEASFDEETDADEEDMESILDACKVLLPEHPLKWHYRSRNEQLIAFSNRHVYDGRLWTFPAAWEADAGTGLGFVHVPDGVYDRGRSATNRREAEVVAERVVKYLGDGSGRSVGVIAFNSTQAQAIAEELDRQRVEHPEIEPHFTRGRLDSVFVKHLEAVQGDERDVIIFSVGYGFDEQRRFSMNFGPLGREGGHRRLNVAITRAREYVEVVSSVLPSDFKLENGTTKHRGPSMLKHYLEYARAHAAERAEESEPAPPPPLPALEGEIANVIEGLGYAVVADVGTGPSRIDLGVRHPQNPTRFMLGVVTDGRNYVGVPTCRDRDRLREEVFGGLGWRIHSIWSIDWVNNRREQIARLTTALTAAAQVDPSANGQDEHPQSRQLFPDAEPEEERARRERPLVDVREDPTALPWVQHYVCAALIPVDSYYEFSASVNHRQRVEMVIEVANTEAPIHLDCLARRLADAFGVERCTKNVVSAVRRAVQTAERRGALELRGDFVFRHGQRLPPVRTPDPYDDRSRREVGEIHCLELGTAIVNMSKASPGSSIEELLPQAARVFGFDRVGGRIRERMLSCLDRLHIELEQLNSDDE